MNMIKLRIYNLIRDDDENDLASNIFDGVIISLIIINVIAIIADTFDFPDVVTMVFHYIEVVSVIIFSAEYILRVWTSDLIHPEMPSWKARLRYVFSPMALIDLLAILPFYIPFIIPIDLRILRMLRIIRLFRVFKFNRYTNAMQTISAVLKKKKSQLISSLIIVFLLMLMAAVLMYNIESDAQPDAFSNAFDALWWAVATLTTVGYGDIYPVTVLGKFLSAVIALLGIGLVAIPTGIISSGFMECIEKTATDTAEDQEKQNEEFSFCPYCGKKLK